MFLLTKKHTYWYSFAHLSNTLVGIIASDVDRILIPILHLTSGDD